MKKIICFALILLVSSTAYADITRKTTKMYFNNAPREIVYYDNGKEILKQTISEDGKIIKTTGKIPDGIVKEYDDNEKITAEWNYKGGIFDGLNKTYYKNGRVSAELNYKNGKLDGMSKKYYDTGNLESERNYKDGKQDGISETYYKSGKLSSAAAYASGKQEGIFKSFYESGVLKSKWNCKNGNIDGEFKTYYKNGKPEIERYYKDGRKQGASKGYDEEGNLSYIEEYENDSLLSYIKFNPKNREITMEWSQNSSADKEGLSIMNIPGKTALFFVAGILLGFVSVMFTYRLSGKKENRKEESIILGDVFDEIQENILIAHDNLKAYREAAEGKKKARLFLRDLSNKAWSNLFINGKILKIKEGNLMEMLFEYYAKVRSVLSISRLIPVTSSANTRQDQKDILSKLYKYLIINYSGVDEHGEDGIIKMGKNIIDYLKAKKGML